MTFFKIMLIVLIVASALWVIITTIQIGAINERLS